MSVFQKRLKREILQCYGKAMGKTPSCISGTVIKTKSTLKNVLVSHLFLLVEQIDDYEKQIQKIVDETPHGGIFRSLPGADYILGARLLVLYSSREFNSASEAQAFWGTCPCTIRSGQSIAVRFRKGCNEFGRNTFHQLAFCSLSDGLS